MQHTKNERGYALLIVLLLIVFITTFAAVFLRGSISNAKQEKVVDNSHLTVVAAEAGVDYYKTLYSNEYFNKVKIIEEQAKTYLQSLLIDNKGKIRNATPEDYLKTRKYSAELLKGYLVDKRFSETSKSLPAEKSVFIFELNEKKPIDIRIQGNGISVLVIGNVIGRDLSTTQINTLAFKQTFMIPSFDPADNGGNTNTGIGDWSYPSNPSSTTCPDKSKIEDGNCFIQNEKVKEIEDSTIYFPNGYTYTKDQDFEIEDSKVYVKGNLRIEKGDLEVEDSFLAVEGSVYVGEKIEIEDSQVFIKNDVEAIDEIDIEDSTLKIGGSLNAKDDLEVEDSYVEIGGSLNVAKEFELEDSKMIVKGSAALRGEVEIEDSMLFVGGALHMSGNQMKIKDNSKVCVAGSLQIDKKVSVSSSSYIYHVGAFAYFGGGTPSLQIKQLSLDEFNKRCSVISAPTPETGIKWPSPSIDVSYQ
ncbi:hypothetical protein DVB69_09945 [Sporosarcina sp. BI001-red]|nr:hypothetical protein DVB69_09945 [Sporosarcina sp. BI001-red]